MYFSGIGVGRDDRLAWSWLSSAANAGNTAAMVEIGMRHASGIGTQQSLIMAVRWYRRAAHLGEAMAAFNLASMYEVGTEVSKDTVRAYAWYQVALQNGNLAARARADELRSKMLREDVERAEVLIKKLRSDPDA
jgi:TPR repeat protein